MRYHRRMTLHVRGRLLETAFARVARLPGGRDALLGVLPASTRERIEPIWMATGWYDAEIFFDVMVASAKLQGLDPIDAIRRGSERAAENDIQGIYRQTLRPTSPRDMADRLPRVFHRYYDAPLTVLALEEHGLRMEIGDVPRLRTEIFQALNEGFMSAALRVAGARDVRFEWTQRAGNGTDCTCCCAHVTWARE